MYVSSRSYGVPVVVCYSNLKFLDGQSSKLAAVEASHLRKYLEPVPNAKPQLIIYVFSTKLRTFSLFVHLLS